MVPILYVLYAAFAFFSSYSNAMRMVVNHSEVSNSLNDGELIHT